MADLIVVQGLVKKFGGTTALAVARALPQDLAGLAGVDDPERGAVHGAPPPPGGALAAVAHQGGGLEGVGGLAVPVVDVFVEAVVVVAVIILGVLHTRFSGVAPRGAAGTGTAARVGGVGSGLGGCPA